MISNQEIGARLRKARNDKGLMRKHVSYELGCGDTAVTSYESGSREPSFERLQRMCSLYGIEVADLFKQEAA
jgi:transcriptional regulator with XRE-family HTH domain